MSLPKKSARKIIVDDHQYCWMATGNDGWIDLIVCCNNNKGQKLRVKFDYHSKYTSSGLQQQFVVKPSIVRQVIIYGLSHGWQPQIKTSDLRLHYLDDKIDIGINRQVLSTNL